MKNYFTYIIFVLLITIMLSSYGCFGRYTIHGGTVSNHEPSDLRKTVFFTLDFSFNYHEKIGARDIARYEIRDRLISLLSQKGFDALYYDETFKEIPTDSISIKITQKSFGDAGLSWFTGLSLGVIPSVESRPNYVTIEIEQLKENNVVEERKLLADYRVYFGIVFLPFFFLDEPYMKEIPKVISETMIELSEKHFSEKNELLSNPLYTEYKEKN